jgi:hypothetical protein
MRLTGLLLALLLVSAPGPSLDAQSNRIVAIGDIHGSLEGFTAILKAAGLIDGHRKWSGGRAQLIQTGDYTDRGAGTRAVLDLLMSLEQQARNAGGRAVVLLCNHEVMNLVGETRDVTREIFATFADANSEKRRQAAWEDYAKLAAEKKRRGDPVPSVYLQSREGWLAAHPPGVVEYMEAFAPRGKYGAWLRAKPMVAEAGGSIFLHAGIPPDGAPEKIDDLNTQLRDEIRRFDRFVQQLIDRKLATPHFTLSEILQVASSEIGLANSIIAAAQEAGREPDRGRLNMPLLMEAQEILKINTWLAIAGDKALWYRGLATLTDDPAGGPFAALLQKYGAKRFVTGHTPQAKGLITVRFGGRAVLIDTGMLTSVYKGRASALEIDGDVLTAIYEDGRVRIP